MDHVCHCADQRLMYPVISLSHLCSLRGLRLEPASQRTCSVAGMVRLSTTVVILCWHICLISESMGHHDSEIMDDRSID
jgi:hypothetical protein